MTEFKRVFVYTTLFLVTLSLWATWDKEHSQGVVATPATQISTTTNSAEPTPTNPTVSPPAAGNVPSLSTTPSDKLISVKTDVLDLQIDPQGGQFVAAKLLQFNKALHNSNESLQLFNEQEETRFTAQTILQTQGSRSPDQITYQAAQQSYQLTPGQQELKVVMQGVSQDGLRIEKTLTMHPGQYQVHVNYHIVNNSAQPWVGNVVSRILRKEPKDENGGLFSIGSYTGASFSDPGNKLFEKAGFSQMAKEPVSRVVEGGWIAMQQHYFLAAWVPAQKDKNAIFTESHGNNLYTIGLRSPSITIPPTRSYDYETTLYAGPENTAVLSKLAPGLELTIDYGILWFLAAPLFSLLAYIYSWVGNWGIAIILLTILIKLLFYRLSASSYRSMAAMRNLQPKVEALRERFGDDRQKLSLATMELYKKEKVNPVGGCLPILIQIPVFIALYWVLIESVELRHAPFFGWITDLSAADPYFILPIVMGLTMFLQQQLNPPPPDPMQAKIMMFLPLMFVVLFINFPAGLVLYWIINNTVSILQQWYIMQKYTSSTAA